MQEAYETRDPEMETEETEGEEGGSIKIAMISTQVYTVPPSRYGGLELVVWDLANALGKMGHDVTIVAPRGSKMPLNGDVFFTGIEGHTTEAQAYEVYKHELERFDIIHDHSWECRPYFYKRDVNPNVKVCHTSHGMQPYDIPPPVPRPNWICISQSHAFTFQESWGKPGKIPYVYNGINLDDYPLQEEKSDRFLFISRLSPFKGAHTAIDLAKKMDIKLDVAGGIFGCGPAYVSHIINECRADNITFHGQVTQEKKIDLYRNAKALILPLVPYANRSGTPEVWVEPFGLMFVEAMACGTPVITTYCGASSEIVDTECGFLCHGFEDMEFAVQEIDDVSPAACRARANLFSREIMADGYEKLYSRMLKDDEW